MSKKIKNEFDYSVRFVDSVIGPREVAISFQPKSWWFNLIDYKGDKIGKEKVLRDLRCFGDQITGSIMHDLDKLAREYE